MSNIWLCSDWHFSHRGIVKFLKEDGTKVRPWETIEEMNEAMIALHNSVVRPTDKVYHLGDAVINRSALPIIGRLNGEKILIKGNHDVFRLEEYTPYFKDIRGVGQLDDFVLTHVPVHPDELAPKGRWKGNIHGHLHSNKVMKQKHAGAKLVIDPRYMCVSMEHINFTPISLEDAKLKFEAQQ